MRPRAASPGGLALALALALAAAPSCASLLGDFGDGLGGPPSGAASSSAGAAGGSSGSSVVASSSGTGGGPACTTTPCSYTPPQCCPSGDHCTQDPNLMPACTKAGSQQPGQPCATDADCAGPALCDDPGECRTVCRNDADCSPQNTCGVGVWVYKNNQLEVVATTCGDVCDPTAGGAGCPGKGKCDVDPSYANTGPLWLTRCFLAGGVMPGSPCQFITDCVPGSGCISGSSGAVCEQYCDFGSTATNMGCPSGKKCTDLSPVVLVRGKHYGVCQ
jgi:hypothetical protein